MSLGKRKVSRGSILVMSIFFMLILFITASAFLVLLPVESRAAMRTEKIAQGGLAADAGVNEALIWARYKLAPKDGSASQEPMASGVYPSQAQRTRDLGNGWAYRWSLIPDGETYPNGSNPIRAFTIVSRSYYRGVVQREARAEVIQESLSEYAELFNTWPSNLVKGIDSDDAPAGGPVHVNDVLRLWIREGAPFWSSTGTPVFDHGLTSSGSDPSSPDGFLYYQGNWSGTDANKRPYNNSGPIESRYNRMVKGGRNNMKSGVDDVPLPENSFAVRDAAWGFNATNPRPTSNGVYINEVAGEVQGVYIQGNVEEMQLGFGGTESGAGSVTVNYGDNSWVKIEQPGASTNSITAGRNATVITVASTPITLPAGARLNGATLAAPQEIPVGTTLMRNYDGTFRRYNSELNGVVYVNGDINDLWGVNKGRRTVTVEGDADNNVRHKIYIGGRENDSTGAISTAAGEKGIVQFGATDSDGNGVLDPPANADHVLGIIGRDVIITDRLKGSAGRWDTTHPQTNPLYLYCLVLGGLNGDGGSYKVDGYNSGGMGWAYRYGSRIIVDAGAWGTTDGHGLVNGTSFYDAAAAQSPPPYFPAKPTFVLKSYIETPVLTGETL